jgi:outer membrane autotransporter protein
MVLKDRRAHNNQQPQSTSAGDGCGDLRSVRRARLLSGTSSLALAIASTIVALGVCVPGDAWAQTQTIVNPVQSTTFSPNPTQNPITFGPTTNITTNGGDAIVGASGTVWDVTIQSQATVHGNRNGILLDDAGSSLTNSGDVSGANSVGVNLTQGGTVVNQATGTISGRIDGIDVDGDANITNAGTITGTTKGVSFVGAGSSLVNSGTITQTDTGATFVDAAVFLANGGTVTNQAGGKITGLNGISADTTGSSAATVTNAGTITAPDAFGTGVIGNVSSVTNRTGGTIHGGKDGINLSAIGATVTNEKDATISGGPNGIVINGSVTNAGTIAGATNSVKFTGAGTNTLTLQTGSILRGDALGSTGATNNLILQGSGAANNNFVGFNTLEVQKNAGWNMNGSAVVRTATIQTNGRLAVGDGAHRNALLTGNVIVNSGAVLSGVGKIAGNVDVFGQLRPGFSTGTLSVTGNVGFQPGSTFFVTTTPDSTVVSKLAVGGAATLTGGTVSVAATGTGYAPSTQYTILHADGGFQGTKFAGVAPLAFLTPSLSYDANNVFLTLNCNGTNCSNGGTGGGTTGGGTTGGGAVIPGFGFATVTQTRNQTAVATSLDGGLGSNPLIAALITQSVEGARQAFDALSGEIYGSLHNAQAEEAQFARSGMLGRMRQMSYAGVADELGALAFGGPQLAYASADANGGMPMKAAPREASHGLTFWAQGLGGWGHSDSDGNAASLTNRFGGFLSGADARLGETWRAGLVAGYVRSDLNVGARSSSAGIDSVQFGGYAAGRLGAFNVRGGVSYSLDSIDTSRAVFFPGFTDQAKARFHGNVGQVFGEIGYGMAFNRVAVEPIAGLAYVHLHDNSFLESGGVAALSGSAGSQDTGYSTLGVRVATAVPFADGTVLVPRATMQWQHAFGDVTPGAALAFQGTGTAFSIAGIPIARDTALVEGGFDWRFTPHAKLGAFYQGELAAHAQTHALKGTFTWDF